MKQNQIENFNIRFVFHMRDMINDIQDIKWHSDSEASKKLEQADVSYTLVYGSYYGERWWDIKHYNLEN